MSKLTDQQLDDLFFGHLRDLEKDPPNGSWPLLAKNVAKNNFLKFGWKHFNIFYVAFIATTVVSTAAYFVLSAASSPEPSKLEKSGTQPDSLPHNLNNIKEQEGGQEQLSPTICFF